MYKTGFILLWVCLVAGISCRKPAPHSDQKEYAPLEVTYVDTYRDSSQVDTYDGELVADPYRWLEMEYSNSVRYWTREQMQTAEDYFSRISFREAIRRRLTQLWDAEIAPLPQRKGPYYYLLRPAGTGGQARLFRARHWYDSLEMVMDPARLFPGTAAMLEQCLFSGDGAYAACLFSEDGSDWRTIRMLDLDQGKLFGETLRWVKYSGLAWYGDGFFYSRFPEPADDPFLSVHAFHQVFYHRLGEPQEKDELVFADRTRAQRNFLAQTTEDERYLLISGWDTANGNSLYLRDLRSRDPDFIPVVERLGNRFELVGNMGSRLFFLTDYQAPKGRLIQINARNPAEAFWEEIIPESEDVLQSARLIGGRLLATYIHQGYHQLSGFDLNGRLEKVITLPGQGTVEAVSGAGRDGQAFFRFSTFVSPPQVFLLHPESWTYELYQSSKTPFDGAVFETKQIWYESYDGEKIPMFIIHKKGLPLNGQNPVLLYGCGAFNVSLLPRYNPTGLHLFPVVLENGGICAVANIRGGGEMGARWHRAGMRENKQVSLDDFQAAAEYLVANKYTSSEKIAIYGRGGGGLLVGACLTQRPKLYGAAIAAEGIQDMLRYQHFTIGWTWAGEFGLSEDPAMFGRLLAYSPLHNTVADTYPATLIVTGARDDRVVTAHSYKFASELQFRQRGTAPVLIRIDPQSGHGPEKKIPDRIAEATDILSFLFYNLDQSVIYK